MTRAEISGANFTLEIRYLSTVHKEISRQRKFMIAQKEEGGEHDSFEYHLITEDA